VRLRPFGSATAGSFDPAAGDLDLLVDFGQDALLGISLIP